MALQTLAKRLREYEEALIDGITIDNDPRTVARSDRPVLHEAQKFLKLCAQFEQICRARKEKGRCG